MSNPVIAEKCPFVVELEPGRYTWCACGKSAEQPFCDGSRDCSSFAPVVMEITEKSRISLCGCKSWMERKDGDVA
jgi:CDGSH-type Zn-finger protein